jgi:hypothetical protein
MLARELTTLVAKGDHDRAIDGVVSSLAESFSGTAR